MPLTQCYEYNSGHEHKGFDPHYHIWQYNKKPDKTCQWNKFTDRKHTLDGKLPPLSNMNPCNSYISWINRKIGK